MVARGKATSQQTTFVIYPKKGLFNAVWITVYTFVEAIEKK